MKISKKDALAWFSFFSSLDEEEELMVKQEEIVWATIRQIERTVENEREKLKNRINNLKTLRGRTYYVGDEKKFPKGCISCLTGNGLSAVRRTNRCNIECKFCYNYGSLEEIPPIGEDMWEIGGTKFLEEDIDLLLSIYNKPSGIAYVYLEPFMEIEKYYGVISKFHKVNVYQHMYTNGLLANKDNLIKLGEAGLNELRFNLGATNVNEKVIENMKIAKKYIPFVGIETPMTPEFKKEFLSKKDLILNTGIDFINCAELHLNDNNLGNYLGENIYMTRLGYISPIFSRNITLELMEIASKENWPIVVHDCSNMTKFSRDLNLGAKEGGWFGKSSYGIEFSKIPYEAFLPVLKDESFKFMEEEELPLGYRVGELIF